MSLKQLNRYSTIKRVLDGLMTIAEAATSLGICERQVKRLKKGVSNEGAGFLLHKNTNRKPKHSLDPVLAEKNRFPEKANFLHFQELLERQEDISISYSALHVLLTQSGVKSPKSRRRFKPHRRRKRKPQAGLLIQMDATPFEWFGTSDKFALHRAIDYATGDIVGFYMTKNECLHGYWQVIGHFKVVTDESHPLLHPKVRVTVLVSPVLGIKVQYKKACLMSYLILSQRNLAKLKRQFLSSNPNLGDRQIVTITSMGTI